MLIDQLMTKQLLAMGVISMAFKDITRVLYDGEILLEYKDSSHRYFARPRINWELNASDPKAWGKTTYPKGTTTLIGDTLEKKGLMTWPLGLALKEIFGYYDFIGDDGTRKQGFQDGVGTMWGDDGPIHKMYPDEALPLIESAHKAWTRKQKEGADIGTTVHNAIEHYINGQAFDIEAAHRQAADGSLKETEIKSEVEKANLAFHQFVNWWEKVGAHAVALEEVIYSKKYNVSGTFDAVLEIGGRTIIADFKTSNASKSKEAAMPEGINYQYFIQSAIYAMIWEEMGNKLPDDLLIVSCRKDGGFTAIYASDLGLTVEQCVNWAKAVIVAWQYGDKTKNELIAHAKGVV